MKTVLILCLVLVAVYAERVRVVENSGDLNNVDPAYSQPHTDNDGTLHNVDPAYSQPHTGSDGQLYDVDPGFYRPTVNNNPNGGYEPISHGPEIVPNPSGPYQNGPPGYPYRSSAHPGARGGK